MNKGIVVQLEYNVAVIMKNDGMFITCPRDQLWQVGDVVTVLRRRRIPMKALLISCAVLLLALVGTGAVSYNIPVTYIEISVNPSVQIMLNRFDRVLSVTGLNPDGEKLLQGMENKNLTLYEAYSRIFNRLENSGYLRNATVQLVVSNNSQKAVDRIEEVLRDASEKYAGVNDMRISIMRYTNDEFLSQTHPLPIMEIPDFESQDTVPSGEQPANSPHCGRWRTGWWDWDSD